MTVYLHRYYFITYIAQDRRRLNQEFYHSNDPQPSSRRHLGKRALCLLQGGEEEIFCEGVPEFDGLSKLPGN